MATYENAMVEKKDGIAFVTLNRPKVLNALNAPHVQDLTDIVDDIEKDESIRAVIMTGAGEKAFAAGADINALQVRTTTQAISAPAGLRMLCSKIENSMKIYIAAINGFAFGGGFELALACDMRVAATTARFGLPETNLGILPGGGGTVRLARVAGMGVAKDMILGGRTVKGEMAVTLGIAMKCVEDAELMNEAIKVAETIKSKGPLGLALAKKCVNAAFDADLNTALNLEGYAFAALLDTEDKKEGTTAFIEKRDAVFKNC